MLNTEQLDYFKSEKDTSSLTLTLEEGVEPDKVTSKVINQLKEKGSLKHLGEYEVLDTAMLTKGIGQILSTITYFITAVAGISLFIAGVGVMNMMYISVSERTKEIGIRRALGATRKSIMLQFLLEGLILTLSGGLIGYLLGMALAYSVGSLIRFSARSIFIFFYRLFFDDFFHFMRKTQEKNSYHGLRLKMNIAILF
ncbi:hypothetical protein EfmAA242_32980 (plasmid) [Enterococcus faecium]|nr:hypothetical protein EfmAA242_32980 [Enterococcus faecium]